MNVRTFSFLIASLLLLLCACEKSVNESNLNLAVGERLYSVKDGDIMSYLYTCKGIGPDTRSIDDIEVEPILQDGDTVMYIVNYNDGWEVLSADKRAPVVLMTCDSGHLEEQELYQNEYQAEYVNMMKTAISDLGKSNDAYPISEDDSWNDIALLAGTDDTWTDWYLTGSTTLLDTLGYQDHLLTTHWGQSGKWNKKAPFTSSSKTNHCYTGCVMVAGSQVLYYLHYKLGSPLSTYTSSSCTAYIPDNVEYVRLNDNNITFSSIASSHWDLMPLSQSENVPQVRFDYVSTLMSRLGYLVSATYRIGGTSATTSDLISAFEEDFSIDATSNSQPDFSIVRNQIIQYKLPCIFALGNSSTGGGHSVVADGYKDIGIFTRLFYEKHNNQGQILKKEERILNERHQFIAINWGWDGTGDYDQTTHATIWYNIQTINWRGYDTFRYMLYDFKAINN